MVVVVVVVVMVVVVMVVVVVVAVVVVVVKEKKRKNTSRPRWRMDQAWECHRNEALHRRAQQLSYDTDAASKAIVGRRRVMKNWGRVRDCKNHAGAQLFHHPEAWLAASV